MQLARRWCYTLNNYTDDEVTIIRDYKLAKFHCLGFEEGASATPHIQGYISLKSPARLSAMKKFLARAHWEKAKGDEASNIVYCSKEGQFEEWGIRNESGKRSDLLCIKEDIDNGMSYDELWDSHFDQWSVTEAPYGSIRTANNLEELSPLMLSSYGVLLEPASPIGPSDMTPPPLGYTLDMDGMMDTSDNELQFLMNLTDEPATSHFGNNSWINTR